MPRMLHLFIFDLSHGTRRHKKIIKLSRKSRLAQPARSNVRNMQPKYVGRVLSARMPLRLLSMCVRVRIFTCVRGSRALAQLCICTDVLICECSRESVTSVTKNARETHPTLLVIIERRKWLDRVQKL